MRRALIGIGLLSAMLVINWLEGFNWLTKAVAWPALSHLAPPEDNMKQAPRMAERIGDVERCLKCRQQVLDTGRESPTNAGTYYRTLTVLENARKDGCLKN